MKSKVLLIIVFTTIITATLFGCSNNQPDTTSASQVTTTQTVSDTNPYTETFTQVNSQETATSDAAVPKTEPSETESSQVQTDAEYSEPEINFSDLE